MRYMIVVMIVAVLLLASTMPAAAESKAETGLLAITNFKDVVAGTGHAYRAFSIGPADVFGTLVTPERGEDMGIGIDAGARGAAARGGIGFIDSDMWGPYLRLGIQF